MTLDHDLRKEAFVKCTVLNDYGSEGRGLRTAWCPRQATKIGSHSRGRRRPATPSVRLHGICDTGVSIGKRVGSFECKRFARGRLLPRAPFCGAVLMIGEAVLMILDQAAAEAIRTQVCGR
jgi:hypothetical protein